MKKLFVILIVLLVGLKGFGQVYLEYKKEYIKRLFEIFDNESIDSTPIFLDSNDVLKVSLISSVNKTEAIYFFNKESKYGFDVVGNCYKVTLNYYCTPCAEKHLKIILENKKYKWVRINENQYISKRKYGWLWNSGSTPNMIGSAVLIIDKKPSQEKCLELNIEIKVYEKEKWKTIIKSRKN